MSSLEEREDKERQKRGARRDRKDEGVELKEEQECSHYFLPEDFFPPWVGVSVTRKDSKERKRWGGDMQQRAKAAFKP